MDDSGSGEITVDVATDGEMPKEMMADISEHRQSSAFSRKVKRELMEMQMRDDMAFLSNKETRDLMKILKSSSVDDVQFRGNQNMREMMERQFSSSVDDMPFCGNMVHIMDCELYKVVRDKSTDADKFVDVLEQVFTRNKVDLATIFFDHVTPRGDSLLHVAAEGGSEQALCLIAFHYPKLLYKRNLKGDTPLHVAARFGNVLAIKNILDMDKHFMTSFDEEKAESVDKVEFIMLRNIYGRTALHEAVFWKHYAVVLFLLVAHEQGNLTSYWTWYSSYGCKSPMYFAVLESAEDILDLLLRLIPTPSLRKTISNGDSPLHAAILEQNAVLLEMIVDRRQELLYQRPLKNNTPIHYAAYAGYKEGVCIMLKRSPMIAFQRNSDGNLPIHLACQKCHDQVVKELLEIEWPNAGLFLNHKGQNIVHIAAMNGGDKITRNLLKHPKIDRDTLNERDINGDTPLHLAARELRLWTLYSLSRHKMVNVNIVNNKGFTARDVVWMQRRIPPTVQEALAGVILFNAGTRLRGNELGMKSKISINKEWNVKEAANILVIVAILIATVSFTAGFTVPGGFYSSDSSITKERGMALLSNQTLFKIFMAFDTIAMYSSILGSIVLLWVPRGDPRLAERAYWFACTVVYVALIAMSVAFQAAIRLIVSNNTLLAHVVTVIGFISIFVFLFYLVSVRFPLGNRLPIFRQIADLLIGIFVYTTYGSNDVSDSDILGSQPS
ncbi:hypothetical protein K1719_024115 [Acacia pycnantha]|nr:hypothetical protein K1719_024115 [Acacia pycnantha]